MAIKINRGLLVFAGSSAICVGCIWYVFWLQSEERRQLRQGVIKDLERQRLKRIQREARANAANNEIMDAPKS